MHSDKWEGGQKGMLGDSGSMAAPWQRSGRCLGGGALKVGQKAKGSKRPVKKNLGLRDTNYVAAVKGRVKERGVRL